MKKTIIVLMCIFILTLLSTLKLVYEISNYEYKIIVKMLDGKTKQFSVKNPSSKPKIYLNENTLYTLSKCDCDTTLLIDNVISAKIIKQHQ